jgi:hypothetical protein
LAVLRSLRLLSRRLRKFVSDIVEFARQKDDPNTGVRLAALLPKLFPSDPENWVLYARASRNATDEATILATLREGAVRTKDSPEILHEMVVSHIRLRQLDEASALIDRFESDAGGWKHLAEAEIHAEERNREATEAALNAALQKANDINVPDFEITGGTLLAAFPEMQSSAIEMLYRGVRKKEDFFGRVMLAVLLQDSAPEQAAANLKVASNLWNGSDEQFERYISEMGWRSL